MDKKTKQKIFAIIVTMLSLITSAIGCALGIPQATSDTTSEIVTII